MEIVKNREGEKLTVSLTGRLDTTTAPSLEAELKENFAGTKDLVIDFAHLDYISSAGLRVVLMAQKTMKNQGSLVIKNVSDEIMEVFDITGFSDILTIEK